MKINATKKIILEEFPGEVRGWLTKLVDPLNRFLEQVYYSLVKGLTIADNLKAQTAEISIAANQTYPIKVGWSLNERPTAVIVAYIIDASGAEVPVHSMSWYYNNGTLEITFVGLTPANKYYARILGLV